MDDLLVIILTLVFAAAGIFGQFNKKKQTQKTTDEETLPGDDNGDNFWDILGDDSEREEEPAYVPLQDEKSRAEKKQKPQPEVLKSEKLKKAAAHGTSVFDNDLTKDNNNIEKTTKKAKQNDRFKLRKAVIYSEILNRKYT